MELVCPTAKATRSSWSGVPMARRSRFAQAAISLFHSRRRRSRTATIRNPSPTKRIDFLQAIGNLQTASALFP